MSGMSRILTRTVKINGPKKLKAHMYICTYTAHYNSVVIMHRFWLASFSKQNSSYMTADVYNSNLHSTHSTNVSNDWNERVSSKTEPQPNGVTDTAASLVSSAGYRQ